MSHGRNGTYDEFDYRRGQVPGRSKVNKFGINSGIGTTLTTLSSQDVIYVPVTTGETATIVSDSSDDTVSGPGARYMVLGVVDSDYNEKSVNITMNGTTGVALTSGFTVNSSFQTSAYTGTMVASNRAALGRQLPPLKSSGSSQGNVGNITVTGDSSSTIFAQIPAPGSDEPNISVTQQSIYTVPSGKQFEIDEFYIECDKTSGGGNPVLSYYLVYYDFLTETEYSILNGKLNTAIRSSERFGREIFEGEFREKSTIQIKCKSSSNNTFAYFRFSGVLIDNPTQS